MRKQLQNDRLRRKSYNEKRRKDRQKRR